MASIMGTSRLPGLLHEQVGVSIQQIMKRLVCSDGLSCSRPRKHFSRIAALHLDFQFPYHLVSRLQLIESIQILLAQNFIFAGEAFCFCVSGALASSDRRPPGCCGPHPAASPASLPSLCWRMNTHHVLSSMNGLI